MSERTVRVSADGIGLGGAVFIVFLVLKLTERIDWSWWWVTAPLWMPVSVVLAVVAVVLIAWGVVAAIGSIADTIRRNRRLARQVDELRRRQAGN